MNEKNKDVKKNIDWNLFEHIIIYNALTNETYLASIIDIVQPIFFANVDIRTIFDVVASFYRERNCTPNTTEIKLRLITPEQKEAFKRIVSEFANIDRDYNYDDLMKNTERFFRERAVYHAILKTASEHSNNEIDTSKIYDTFEKACNISLVNDLGCNYFDDIDKHIEDLKRVNTVIPTGFQWLDERIGGGVQEHGRALYIVSGVTNSGKSILLGNIGANFLSLDKTVVIISLEMSEAIYAKRISSQLSQIPLNRLVNQSEALKAFIQDYRSHHPQSKLFIKEYAPKEITVNHIKAYIKQLINKRRIKPDVIIVDYVNLIEASPATGDSYTDVKKVSEQLRALSYIFSVPVISATQLNRSGYDKQNPGLETTSESMGLAHTADVQFAVWSNETDKDLGIIHLGMQKNRFGPNFGTKALRIDYDTLRVYQSNDDIIGNKEVNSADSTIETLLNDLKTSDNLANQFK